jgi:NAD(P)-dependent dehydrogenase (short-subunit alcohol dehydrogenase family)
MGHEKIVIVIGTRGMRASIARRLGTGAALVLWDRNQSAAEREQTEAPRVP